MVKPLYQLRGPGPRMGGNRINDGGVSYDEGVRNTTSSSRAAQPTQDVVVSPDANPHPIDTNPGGNQPFNRPNPLPSPDLSPQPPPWHQHTCQPNNQPARPEPDTRANLPICPGIRPSPRAGDPKPPYLRYRPSPGPSPRAGDPKSPFVYRLTAPAPAILNPPTPRRRS